MNLLAALAILEPIERPLTAILEWLHATIGLSWAWAIIVLTLIVRIALVPLTVKQIRSMQHLQQHAPELKAIQQKYKGDRQRMNEEVMKFYRENQINPAASCLPVLIQIPIFIALYYTLRGFEKNVFPKYPNSDLGWLNIVPNITDNITAHWSGWLLVAIYVGSQLGSIMFTPMPDPRQKWIIDGAPVRLHPFHRQRDLPGRALALLGDDEPLDGWAGPGDPADVPRPPAPPKRSSRTPPKETTPPAGDGAAAAKSVQPSRGAGNGQQRVRRRKKKGPRSRR